MAGGFVAESLDWRLILHFKLLMGLLDSLLTR